MLHKGGTYRCQYRVLRDGLYRWVEACGHVEMDQSGRPVRFPGVLLDIEERRRIEVERDQMLETLKLANGEKMSSSPCWRMNFATRSLQSTQQRKS